MSPDDDPPITVDDIHWVSAVLPRLEDRRLLDRNLTDLLTLDVDELAVYCYDLQCELRTVRTFWHRTIGALTRVAEQRDRAVAKLRKGRRA